MHVAVTIDSDGLALRKKAATEPTSGENEGL
jgi:hypothetical protein